ncbi:MAG: DUF4097 domain-containing protein [Lachnospiraceae bacterium]|nr:DUF4097 domain-containing protein [Lachnospiraceae bacterium]
MKSIRRFIAIILIVAITSLTSILLSASNTNQSVESYVMNTIQDRGDGVALLSDYHYEYDMEEYDYDPESMAIIVKNSIGDVIIRRSEEDILKVDLYRVPSQFVTVNLMNNELYVTTDQNFHFTTGVNNSRITVQVPRDFRGYLNIQNNVGDVTVYPLNELEDLQIYCNTGDIDIKGANVNGGTSIVSNTGDIVLSGATLKDSKISTSTGDIDFYGDFDGNALFESNVGNVKVILNGAENDYSVELSGMGKCSYNSKSFSNSYSKTYAEANNYLTASTAVGKVTVSFK